MLALRRIERALRAIESYEGDQPLHQYLKNWYRRHPEMGSRDRKLCSELCFTYFRTGRAFLDLPKEKKLAISLYLINDIVNEFNSTIVSAFTPFDPATLVYDVEDKIKIVETKFPFNVSDFFPFDNLSEGITEYGYSLSMLHQPLTWIRVEPGMESLVEEELEKNEIQFTKESNIFGFSNGLNLGLTGLKNTWYTVQDKNSQMTGNYFLPQTNEKWYDCCAASGGKSLLLHSLNPGVHLTVSDNRASILENLKVRFKEKNLINYKSFIADLEKESLFNLDMQFDGIIADVPCTGSGTWARTPEQLSFFNYEDILRFTSRQKSILKNVAPNLKRGKPLIYITCSVFKKENEEMVDFICNELNFFCEEQKVLTGIQHLSDTMFVARLIKK